MHIYIFKVNRDFKVYACGYIYVKIERHRQASIYPCIFMCI